MILPLYRTSMTLAAPAIDLLLARRARNGKEDRSRLGERRGVSAFARPPGRLIWLHAVSVGESISALVLIDRLLEEADDLHVLVTTGTVSSARILAGRLPDRSWHQFAPIDRPAWVGRFLDHWQPDLALFFEAEFWPEKLLRTHERGVPIVAANARMSDRSYRGWRRWTGLSGPMFRAIDLVLATSSAQADQFRALGARRVTVAGNLKRAANRLPLEDGAVSALRREIGSRAVWLAASTHEGEEEAVVRAQLDLLVRHPGLLAVIAPRHPDRGPAIAELVRSFGLAVARRAAGERIDPDTSVYIADTLGEMSLFFNVASVVFVAGSLVPVGGHNPVEPAHFDCAVLFGPLMTKNLDIADEMIRAGAAIQFPDAEALGPTIDAVLTDGGRRHALTEAARRYASSGRAVLDGIVTSLHPFLDRRE